MDSTTCLKSRYRDAEYKRLNGSLYRRIGTLNCGHSAMGIIFGVNDPQYTAEELEEMRRENEEGITYEGKHKAIAFQKILGYTIDNKDGLLSQVRSNLGRYRASERKATKYGRPFEVEMLIHGANGKIAPVKTAWQIDHGSEIPRLVSIYID